MYWTETWIITVRVLGSVVGSSSRVLERMCERARVRSGVGWLCIEMYRTIVSSQV